MYLEQLVVRAQHHRLPVHPHVPRTPVAAVPTRCGAGRRRGDATGAEGRGGGGRRGGRGRGGKEVGEDGVEGGRGQERRGSGKRLGEEAQRVGRRVEVEEIHLPGGGEGEVGRDEGAS